MSRLFMATDLALNRRVVIKILPPELTSDMMAARFKREAEVTAHLQHPHILPIITAGLKDGLLYYIMPFIPGESLRERLKREGKLPIEEAVTILCEVAGALAYAHKQGVVHRDIKPENILLEDGQAVLADFGIAAALAGPHHVAGEKLTRTGMSMGTVGYMAPEQSLGGSDVDSRADIYSLGVVTYEMLAGSAPFAGGSTQAILAAHLTQLPPRIDRLRDDIPIPVCRAIEKALEKDPAKRFQTAGEFSSACSTQKTAGKRSAISRLPVVRDLHRLPIKNVVAAAVVAVVSLAGAWYVFHRPPVLPNETVTIVVAPFDVTTRALKVWHEGMVDLLARNIDGAGLLRVVPPVLAIRNWQESARSVREPAVQLAQRTKAQYAIYGSIVPALADSLRLHFELADAVTDSVLADVELISMDVKQLANALTLRVVNELGKRHRIGAVRVTSIGSDSAQALKSFLEGEQYYRRTSWDSAAVAYDRAISVDTGFALALRRAGQVTAWRTSEGDSVTRSFALRAGARNRNLATRDSLLIVADSLRSALEGGDVNQPDWRLGRRLFATVNEAVARYPNDPEVWYMVGEARFHHGYGSMLDMSEPEVRDAFNRSVSLDSAFAPAYIHLVELGFTLDGAAAGRVAALQYLARNPAGENADGIRLLDLVTDPASDASKVATGLDAASSAALLRAWARVRRWPDSAETALLFLRALARHPRSAKGFAQDSVRLATFLPLQLAYRGRLHEAYLAIGNRPTRLFAQLALLGAIDPDTASVVFAQWLAAGNAEARTALPWWAARGDTASILALLQSFRVKSAQARAERKAYPEYDSQAANAYLLLARRDTTNAVKAFALLSDTLCLRCDQDHLTTARLLAKGRAYGPADKILRQRLYSLVTPAEIVIALERGKVAEAAGQRDVARRSYGLVIRAWARGDPEVQALVQEARAGLGRLGGG